MDNVEVSTVVYVEPEAIYEFLLDFPGYANYSKYLEEVRQDGDGAPGTCYDLEFAWWKLSYTARSEVTSLDPPKRIDWKLVKDIDAHGYWAVESVPEVAPAGEDHASRVSLTVQFDPETASSSALDLPRFVSFDWVLDKVKPLIQDEAERIVERIVEDLEGRPRDVDLRIHSTPDSM